MRLQPTIVVAGFLLLQILFVTAVAAQGDTEAEAKRKAQASFNRGRASFEQQRYVDAATAFREAYDIMPSWRLLYNIGQAETAGARYGLALDAFERYLALGGDDVPTDRREEVIAEMMRLRAMIGFIEVKAPDGAIVFVDNVQRGVAPLPGRIRVTAGIEHTVFVEHDSESIFTRTVVVSGGESITVEAKMLDSTPIDVKRREQAADAAQDAETETVIEPKPKTEKSPLLISGAVLTGVGGAAAIGGVVAGILAMNKNKTLEKDCEGTSCASDRQGDIDSLQSTAMVSSILIPVGGALAATGVVLIILHAVKAKGSESLQVTFAPVVEPGFGGLQLQGRF